MNKNKLKLNAEKTHVLTLGTSQRLQRLHSVLKVEMNGITLEESSSKSELLLGCCISSNLKWHCQINQVLDRLKKRIAALETIKNVVDFDTRKRLTEGLFTSILSYCLPLYGGCDKRSLDSLQVMQSKAARLVTLSKQGSSRKDMFDRLHWFTVRQLMFYHTALTVFRVRNSGEPEYLHSIFSKENQRGNLIVPNTPLSLAKVSFCYRGASEWNRLPHSIRNLQDVTTFKRELRQWIFVNIEQF